MPYSPGLLQLSELWGEAGLPDQFSAYCLVLADDGPLITDALS
jgi:hypothetical protein